MVQTFRPLPGIRFESHAPQLEEVLPRMDIAGFVGFAASGPLDVPVPIEDATQFASIFGGDVPLAWDAEHGELAHGLLAPAVRAFFRNGGRRSWVVRVANAATATFTSFQLPGVAAVRPLNERGPRLGPAVFRARSEGSWADGLHVSASIEPTPIAFRALSLRDLTFDARPAASDDLIAGDLVRVGFPGRAWVLYVAVKSVSVDGDPARVTVHGDPDTSRWVRVARLSPHRAGRLHYLGPDGEMHAAEAVVVDPGSAIAAEGLARMTFHPPVSPPGSAPPPEPGSIVRAVFAARSTWLDIADIDVDSDGTLALVATPFEVTKHPPNATLVQASGSLAERLTLRLEVDDGAGGSSVLGGLGFLPSHPRFVGALPTDAAVFATQASGAGPPAAAAPRFPLAGPEHPPIGYLPLGASIVEEPALGALGSQDDAPLRDGLERFDPDVFVDPDIAAFERQVVIEPGLGGVDPARLLEQAFWIEYGQPEPRPLRGMHALLGIEEVTIVAAPDAVQRGWSDALPDPATPVNLPELPGDIPPPLHISAGRDAQTCSFAVQWDAVDAPGASYELQEAPRRDPLQASTVYRGTKPRFDGRPRGSTLLYRVRAIVAGRASAWSDWVSGQFAECAMHVPRPPLLTVLGEDHGAFSLEWSSDEPGAAYELQESVDAADESAAETLYAGQENEFHVYGRAPGSTLYYRVRAVVGDVAGGWSNWVLVQTARVTRMLLDDIRDYDAADALLPVQRSLLRMSAARGDVFAVLALPEHFTAGDAIAHVDAVRAARPSGPSLRADPVLSYGAVYHPWLYSSDPADPQTVRRVPPDGAASGIIAARAAVRGAWVAPANEPLRDVVELDPPLGRDWFQALQDAQVNVVRHEPHGFLWLAADTLCDDVDLRSISVRRLLQLLRRVATKHGAAYAFEPNGDAFHRTVQRGFERLLARMFELGAFAGAKASDAYRVNTGSPPNTPESVDAGTFIVELQVAPSRPLRFLTVRLVRAGDGSLQVEAR